MASVFQPLSTTSSLHIFRINGSHPKLWPSPNLIYCHTFPRTCIKKHPFCCTAIPPWEETSPVIYSPPNDDSNGNFLNKTASNIFETLHSNDMTEKEQETRIQPLMQLQFLKWPMWLLGPVLLLTTGMVPTLWLPISSIFMGANMASLLSLIGLDSIFNLGSTLFLLMAHYCARPKSPSNTYKSKPPFTYQFWNVVATAAGFFVPSALVLASQKGLVQHQLPFISFAVLLGPYILLLLVQILTEMLTWHWQSPVWLVTPVVYGAYRVLQLMRALKLGAEINAPAWMSNTIRGLVLWWVLILGVQLMRVAWFAGLTAKKQQQI